MSQAHAMSQTHAAVISPLEGEAPQQACSPRGDFPRAARTGVLLAVMLIVFLSACGGSSAPETGNGTQQETSELAGDSADNTEADNTEADNTEADNTEADNTEADNTEADNTEADNTEADNTEADNTEADNTEADNTEADNTEADNTEADNTEADNTEADNTEADNTEADNTEADNTEEIPSEEFAVPECDDEASRTDRASLTALYNATDGPNWGDNTNWLTDAPLSEWAGVSDFSFDSECVTSLRLSGKSVDWGDPSRTRQPHRPARSGPPQQSVEWGDPSRTRQPHRPARSGPQL